eukprot:TRINITY_DN8681_c0_g1_i1.p1 TRINITY_DN8681_c0_g1~~TRINITY_DN8681_c0_g1_i1.p1  ORF type:complete len:137 (+),score=10.61 TRINITY_DN8681_c0_g1_i1:32-412(+)
MEIMVEHSAAVKEMEAAAVAYVCRLWDTPMLAIKSVTDIVDGDRPAAEEFLENLQKSSAALQNAIVQVIDYIQGKALNDLQRDLCNVACDAHQKAASNTTSNSLTWSRLHNVGNTETYCEQRQRWR